MKKDYVWRFVLIFIVVSIPCSAQGIDETRKFLFSKLNTFSLMHDESGGADIAMMNSGPVNGHYDGFIIWPRDWLLKNGNAIATTEKYSMKCPDLEDVTYHHVAGPQGENSTRYDHYELVLSGSIKWSNSEGLHPVSQGTLYLSGQTSEEDVRRLVKALKHWASLCGAKLTDDDLFK